MKQLFATTILLTVVASASAAMPGTDDIMCISEAEVPGGDGINVTIPVERLPYGGANFGSFGGDVHVFEAPVLEGGAVVLDRISANGMLSYAIYVNDVLMASDNIDQFSDHAIAPAFLKPGQTLRIEVQAVASGTTISLGYHLLPLTNISFN